MRISDWSSDVCSSDLSVVIAVAAPRNLGNGEGATGQPRLPLAARQPEGRRSHHRLRARRSVQLHALSGGEVSLHRRRLRHHAHDVDDALRSEEHTSELQSLMRISYAVFCLKKKKDKY